MLAPTQSTLSTESDYERHPLVRGDSPRGGEMSRSDKGDGTVGAAIFQKCWQGPGTAFLVAVR